MKYRLTEDWLEYKKGHMFGELNGRIVDTNHFTIANKVVLSLLLKTGILEEVKEEEWPKRNDYFWYIGWNGHVYGDLWNESIYEKDAREFGNIFHSKTEALEASEKIKTLLLSLKK